VQIEVVESRSEADYFSNLTLLATKDTDETFAVGRGMIKDVVAVARRWPKRSFALIDAVSDVPNVTSVTFREQDGAFLAGALAALVTKTKTIGFLGGEDEPQSRRFESAYRAGAREADPAVKVLVRYAGSFTDQERGQRLTRELFGDRADIVVAAAGRAGLGAFDEVKSHRGDYVIGVNYDQGSLAPGKVLTSVVKRIDVAVYRVCEDAVSQKQFSGSLELGLRDGAIGLTDLPSMRRVIAPTSARMTAIYRAVFDGKIAIPTTRAALEQFKPVALN
jgi:basic membrane protein A